MYGSMYDHPQAALVIGAGIGGLTAAIALRRAGYCVSLFERFAELKPAGAGLMVAPNAGLVLSALDLLEDVRASGAEITIMAAAAPAA